METRPFNSQRPDNPPTEEEIDETFDMIQDIFEDHRIGKPENAQVKLGYETALDILDGTKSMPDISKVHGVQASAIAVLAVDYLKGEISRDVLLSVPLKGSPLKPTIN